MQLPARIQPQALRKGYELGRILLHYSEYSCKWLIHLLFEINSETTKRA